MMCCMLCDKLSSDWAHVRIAIGLLGKLTEPHLTTLVKLLNVWVIHIWTQICLAYVLTAIQFFFYCFLSLMLVVM